MEVMKQLRQRAIRDLVDQRPLDLHRHALEQPGGLRAAQPVERGRFMPET